MKRIVLLTVSILLLCVAVSSAATGMVHTVRRGDSLTRLADHYLPRTAAYSRDELVSDIRFLNGLEGEAGLRIGQKLKIPVLRDEPLSPRSVPRSPAFVARGVYLNKWSVSSRRVFAVADELTSLGGNTIVFDAKDVMGGLSYHSAVPRGFAPEARYTAVVEDLPKLIDYLHCLDIHVVARVCGFKDVLMASAMPHWRFAPDWVNPSDPEVQAYLLSVIDELIAAGVDEIQMDYFRYPANGSTDSGRPGMRRDEVIASVAERIHEKTRAAGVLFSMDMFGIVIWEQAEDVRVLGQNITLLAPHLDVLSPMLYPSHFSAGFGGVPNPADEPYHFVSLGVKKLKRMVGDQVVVRPWLQCFPLRVTNFGPDFVRAQIEAGDDNGGTGWLLWSPGNYYADGYGAMMDMFVPAPEELPLPAPAVQQEAPEVQTEPPAVQPEIQQPQAEQPVTQPPAQVPAVDVEAPVVD